MNKTLFAGILTIGASLIISSCIEVDPALGSKYVPTSQDLTIQSTTFDLPVEMRMSSGLQSSLSDCMTVGSIRSELFGTFNSDAAVSLTPYGKLLLGGDPVFKEMYLSLPLEDVQTLSDDQKSIPQNIHVYQLTTELDSTHILCHSLDENDYDHSPVSLENNIFVGEDDLTIYLTEDFARPILQMSQEMLDSAKVFMKNFKGLYIKSDLPEGNEIGGRLNDFDLEQSFAYLTISSINFNGARRDTTLAFRLGSYYSVNIYSCESEPYSEKDPSDALYLEALGGVTPFISGSTMMSITDSLARINGVDKKNLIITKAIIQLPFDYPDNHGIDVFPSHIYPCRLQLTNGTYIYKPLEEVNDGIFNEGGINRSRMCYEPDCSLYLQELTKKNREELNSEDDLWIMPILGYTTSSNTSYYSYYGSTVTTYYVDSYKYCQAILNGNGDERHPQLKITYAVIK